MHAWSIAIYYITEVELNFFITGVLAISVNIVSCGHARETVWFTHAYTGIRQYVLMVT